MQKIVAAGSEYQQQHPHKAVNANGQALVFANSKGDPIRKDTAVKWFSALRSKAEVSDSVVFSSLRDGAATYSGADVNQTKLLLGHRLGEVDKYKLRSGDSVADACKAIEKHYFS